MPDVVGCLPARRKSRSSRLLHRSIQLPKQRRNTFTRTGKTGGSESIPKIAPYLSDPELDVRLEAVKAIVDIGTERSLDPLIKATHDNDPEIQIRATDGLVNFLCAGLCEDRSDMRRCAVWVRPSKASSPTPMILW